MIAIVSPAWSAPRLPAAEKLSATSSASARFTYLVGWAGTTRGSTRGIVTASSRATGTAGRRAVATLRGQGTDDVRIGHRQPAPAGAIGGPLHLQLRGRPGDAGASELARHQTAGAAAARQGGRSGSTNPRRDHSRSRLGQDSAAKASPFRVAEARLLAARPRRVGPFGVPNADPHRGALRAREAGIAARVSTTPPPAGSTVRAPQAALTLQLGASPGASSTSRRRLMATRHGQGADGVRVEHRQPAPGGAIGGPLQLQRRSSPGSSTSATETAQHQTAGAAAARQGGWSSPTNPRRNRCCSGLGRDSMAKAYPFRVAEARPRAAHPLSVGSFGVTLAEDSGSPRCGAVAGVAALATVGATRRRCRGHQRESDQDRQEPGAPSGRRRVVPAAVKCLRAALRRIQDASAAAVTGPLPVILGGGALSAPGRSRYDVPQGLPRSGPRQAPPCGFSPLASNHSGLPSKHASPRPLGHWAVVSIDAQVGSTAWSPPRETPRAVIGVGGAAAVRGRHQDDGSVQREKNAYVARVPFVGVPDAVHGRKHANLDGPHLLSSG